MPDDEYWIRLLKAVDALRGLLWMIVCLLVIACISLFAVCTRLGEV